MKYDVFISYSRKDKKKIEEFCFEFSRKGINYWFDKDGIENGEDFKTVIVKAIEDSEVFLYFSSVNSNASIWTAKEVGIAVARNKHIIPVKLDNSLYDKSVEFDLVNLDFVDYTNKSAHTDVIQKLIVSIKKRTLGEDVELPETQPRKRVFSKLIYLLLFVIILVVCGLAFNSKHHSPDVEFAELQRNELKKIDSLLVEQEYNLFVKNGKKCYDSVDVSSLAEIKKIYEGVDKSKLYPSDTLAYAAHGQRVSTLIDSAYTAYNKMYLFAKNCKAEILASVYKQKLDVLLDLIK